MSFASEMATMANELIAEFGSPREIYFVDETATGTVSAPGTPIQTEYRVNAVVLLKYLDTAEQGTLIDERRREVVMSTTLNDGTALAVVPVSGDKMRFDGYLWTIETVGAVSPGGETIVYKITVKR